MNRVSTVIGIAAALLIGTFLTQVTAFAQIAANPQTNAQHSRIVGLWDVQVTITDCDTGDILGGFPALHKYEMGGTGQVVPATNPARLSAHMMIWSHVEGNDYQMAIKFFRFDAAGNRIGWAVLNNEISIDDDAEEYFGLGISQTFNNDGVLLGEGCPSFQGTRFTGE